MDANEAGAGEAKVLSFKVTDTAIFSEALGLQGRSSETMDGLPMTEFARTVGPDGSSSASDVERFAGGAHVRRSATPAGPSPRDAGGRRKRAEERLAVQKMIAAYNALHGTDYLVPDDNTGLDRDAWGEDVVAISESGLHGDARFQVVTADTSDNLHCSLSLGEPFSTEEDEYALLRRFLAVAEGKRQKADPAITLVLDGRGVVNPEGTVQRFAKEYGKQLGSLPFREVWWADPATAGVVRRLSPPPA
jgi:hypothetical protein